MTSVQSRRTSTSRCGRASSVGASLCSVREQLEPLAKTTALVVYVRHFLHREIDERSVGDCWWVTQGSQC